MAQVFNNADTETNASNLAAASGAGETTILDKIPCSGARYIAVTIIANTGSISACALYGSPDGVKYMPVSGFSSFAVSSPNMGHGEVTAMFQYLRVTTTGVANVDVYLLAVQ
jgi:hypothetical protein